MPSCFYFMSKAIVITRAIDNCSNEEKELINSSNIFKIAVNRANIKSNVRLFHDYAWAKMYATEFDEPLISNTNCDKFTNKIGYKDRFKMFYMPVFCCNHFDKNKLFFHYGSLIPSIDYCIKNGYTDILLVADNNVYTEEFRININWAIDKLSKHCNLYQYSNGYFKLPTLNIKEFLND